MEVTLLRANIDNAKELHAMQVEAFKELLEKYRDLKENYIRRMYGYMVELKYKVCFTSDEVPRILTCFIKQYVDTEKLKKYYLLWSSLNKNLIVKCLPL